MEKKFRCWDKKRKRMYKVLHLNLNSHDGIWATVEGKDIIEDKNIHLQVQPKDCVVMQFTGLLDKNKVDIYESDIISVEYGRGKIIFHAGCFMIEWIDDKEANMEWLGMYHKTHQLGRPREDVEVLGNVFEHPSLLSTHPHNQ